jgi:hypothetical protein
VAQVNKSKNHNEPTVELGTRKISKMNFSYIVTLPKCFVNSPFGAVTKVKRTMLEDGSLLLTPIRQNSDPDDFSVF